MAEPMDDDQTRPHILLTAGALISHYQIIDKIGVGGMGEVFLAKDRQLDRKVALKFLAGKYSGNKEFRDRFLREARAAARLNHPQIVTIYEVVELDNRIFIAMEYVEGQILRDLIDHSPMPPEKSLEIVRQICRGLDAAHREGLVHRDIKPSNVKLDLTQRVRILDFGLAKATGDDQLTQTGAVMGTVNYMSPEQSKGETVGTASDTFSLGAMLYEMLIGLTPFQKDSVPATLQAIAHEPHPPLSAHLCQAFPSLQGIIDKALAKRAEDRFGSIAQMADEIDALVGTSEWSAGTTTTGSRPETLSLAILYLRNIGSDDDDFLCYGLTEDLIIDISRISRVRVLPMRTVLKLKDSDKELEEMAQDLKVRFILDGSVHRSADRIRVSAQLLDTHTYKSLWADRWEQSVESLPQIKKNLAEGIAGALELGQTVIRQAGLESAAARDAEAYENYLRGKYTFDHKKDKADVDVALTMYAKALEQESTLLAARIGIAQLHMHLGEYEKVKQELGEALKEAIERELKAEQGDIEHLYARLYTQLSDWTKAMTHAEAALKIKQALNDIAGEAEIVGVLIKLAQVQSNFDRAIVLFDRVLEIAHQLDDQDRIAEALKNMGIAYARKGDYDMAENLYRQAIEIAEAHENLSLQAACWNNMGNLGFFQGELDKAFERYDRAMQIYTRLGDKNKVAILVMNKGTIEARRLRLRNCLDLQLQAADIFEELEDRSMRTTALLNACGAYLEIGELDQAGVTADEALSLAEEIKHPLLHSDALLRQADVLMRRGEYETAHQVIEKAADIATAAELTRNIAHAQISLAELHIATAEFAQAREHAVEGGRAAKEIREPSLTLRAGLVDARLSVERGLANMGINQLRRLADDAHKLDEPELSLEARFQLGRALFSHGKSDDEKTEGLSLLQEVLLLAREHELHPYVSKIEKALASNA